MNHNNLTFFKNWFAHYTESFYTSNEEDQKNILLKVHHTFNVCSDIIHIAKEQLLETDRIMLAETIALFHDIGRFSQYAKYKTFRDSLSVNHGKLGTEVLEENNIIQNLSESEQELIFNTVKFHNAFSIPAFKNQEVVLFLKLLRDADKLDIWRVFAEYFESSEDERASAVGLGLPDLPEYSESVLSCLYEKKIALLSNLKTLNDLKLMQLSWIYDLNFKISFSLLLERDYINRIVSTLPKTDEIMKALFILNEYANQKQRV